jgi:DNA anti-recombination protein RmuC
VQALIDAIDKMNLEAMPKNAKRGTALVSENPHPSLIVPLQVNYGSVFAQTSFRDEAKAMRDEQGRLEDTNARLQAEVNSLRQRLVQTDRSLQNAAESKSQGDSSSRAQLRDLERSLEEAKEENNKRVNETSQFQQMRKLMQSQSAKIRDLRRRLERYEPDSVKADDGDDI